MVKGTQAVGSGMVKGTQAVGSGVVSAAETVGSGVVSAAESVGSGVVSAAETVGSGVAAVGSGVVKTGEVVGSAAVSGETVDEEAELQVGMMLKVPVREKRKTSRQIQSDSFLSNLSQAFKEVETGDTEQVDTRCMIISNNSVGPLTNNPECGYLIVERNVIILTWGKGNPIHLEQENIQGVNLLYGEEELVGFQADHQQSADTLSLQVVSTSFSESDVFPTCDEQPELEDSSAGTEDISPRHLKTEDSVSDELSNNSSLKNQSFDEHFQVTELSRSKSDEKQDEKTEERVNLGRKRSRKRTISKDRRQSLHYEDTMATYLLIQLSKNCEISEEVCKLKEDKPINLSSETPEFLLRIPNEVVVRLFGMLSRNLSSVYGSAELVDMTGIKQLTIQSLMAGNGDLQVAAVLGQKSTSYEEDCTLPSMDEDTQILEPDEIAAILPNLPPRVVNHTWIKAFSTDRDGFSLSTFYRKLQNLENPVLLVIEDVEDHVFGSLLSEPPLQTDAFTGTGESWLFSIQDDSENSVEIYHWSKKNELFCKVKHTPLLFYISN
ncbi:uncharacterized protein LOC111707503 [Eurytemora carolleeae]|uniref:uncharacterized protein LOC111707503 n=1 Tax=Eurytemora carolleeae TaxID=1294199 RepID=UPI000C789C16|nr:uncharacterized protein LOC111707503 [Eurytemora carolleeae]|eukprot:XP_023336378.1 uncharacterized protein LOC111707503 [Eurytemora affinis]